MRRVPAAVAAVVLLAGPTALAFFSGGYFREPRLVAAIVAWLLVLALAVAGPAPLPRGRPGALALGGLAALAVWSAVSLAWAPLGGPAIENVQRLVLYVGAFALALGALRVPRAMRAVEPALAAGAAVVIGYALSERLLPGVLEFARSEAAQGRLAQPITYWNAQGALAAVGFVLCARLAGDRTRTVLVRALAAAAAAPLAAGVYLSFSRGAIAVAVVGLVVLVAAAPGRAQLRAAVVVLVAGVVAAAVAGAFAGVASLEGDLADREREGAIVLAVLVVVAAAAALAVARAARGERDAAPGPVRASGRARLAVAGLAVGAVVVGLVVGGLLEGDPSAADQGASAGRLTTVSSNRYEYWRVAVQGFAEQPLQGLGSDGFRVLWLRERPFRESVLDVHSLELEIAVELGLVGLLAFAAFAGGVGWAARRALARDAAAAAGPLAAAVTFLLHASIDWDWQLPAVTLPAIVLAAALVVQGEARGDPLPAAAPGERPPAGAGVPVASGAVSAGRT